MRSSKWSNFSLEPPFYIVFGLQMSYLYMLEGVCTSDRPEWIIYGVACAAASVHLNLRRCIYHITGKSLPEQNRGTEMEINAHYK